MPDKKWNLGIAILFIIFACLLLSFLFSTLRIRELVQPLKSGGMNRETPSHIVLISQELDNPFWRSIERGARDASESFGMNLEYIGPFRINPAEQIKLLEKSIAAKADAIVVQGMNDPIYRSLIDKAASRNIPVITVDADEPGSGRLAYVGTDNLEAGKRMGELVVQAAKGNRAGIGVLIGDDRADNQQLRLSGFRSVIDRYPELTVVDVRSSNISRLQAAAEAEDILLKHPQARYLVGFSALDGVGMLEAAARVRPERLSIFAFDDLAETKEGIRQCNITASIVQQPHEMGYEAISLLNDYFRGKPLRQQHFTAVAVLERSAAGTGTGETCR